ncbi:MAG TPA: hypothetical protein VJ746_05535 [Nitrospira sp.]|nr:hypothetical protein [Nitrospira sp.]
MVELSAAIVLSALSAEAVPEAPVQPDADFLEFLGSWSTGHARPQWVDPFNVQELPDQEVGNTPRTRQEPKDRMNKRQPDDQAPAPQPDSSRAREGSKP